MQLPTMSKITIELMPVQNLAYDPQNPRLPASINGSDEEAVVNWMLEDATIIELMGSIGEMGYFPGEPLLVVPAKDKGKFLVVEGNRRLTAAKLLLTPQLAKYRQKSVLAIADQAKHKPKTLPVVVYPKREEILDYLGYRHITGIKPWDPLAKARYLEQLYKRTKGKTDSEKFQSLAKEIGSREDYVAKLLTSYRLYGVIEESGFYNIKGLNEKTLDFSLITTALGYVNIRNFLGLKAMTDPTLKGLQDKALKEFTGWLFDKNEEGKSRIGESRRLKDFNKIVEKPKALAAFRNGESISSALIYTDVPIEIVRTSILEAKGKFETARDHMHLVDKYSPADADLANESSRLIKAVHNHISSSLSGDQD